MCDGLQPRLPFAAHRKHARHETRQSYSTRRNIEITSCHLEGQSDAVTWQFAQGPRDTPSNAGGTAHTGFLMRTALHSQIQDYASVIDLEQGGHFSRSVPLLESDLLAWREQILEEG